ncbi:MAG: iron ABC transporter permease [Eubacterium sp.]|jgi:iron complex transport system permease protein|nr:iron ABC transporter permease [Eubacterium sp.]NBI85391.1 iron ABC transporter permease [Lachnospiraceae bacterium]
MNKPFSWIRFLSLFAILCAVMLTAVSVGSAELSVVDSFYILLHKIPYIGEKLNVSGLSGVYETIVWDVRMPRVLLSALTGGALAVVGAAYQGLFLNSLADPHILGVSSGAALGATAAMLSGVSVSFLGLGAIGVFAFAGALITVFLVYAVAKPASGMSAVHLLLAGAAISTLLSSVISLLMTFHHEQIVRVYLWTMGSFSSASWEKTAFLSVFVLLGTAVLWGGAGKLNIMLLGEEEAKCLGVDTGRLRRVFILASSALVAAAVSVSGIIGFVGLIVPHCVRIVCGPDNRKVMPYGLLSGAVFLVICDTAARTMAAPTEIPVGVVTSLFGAPYFIALLLKKRGRQE